MKPSKTLTILVSLALAGILANGCAYLNSDTRTPVIVTYQGTNYWAYAYTHARSTTFFDSQNQLTKFRNSNGGPTNAYSSGTVVSGLNTFSSGSNVVQLLNDVAAIVSKAP